jgi:hypothetical protein
MRAVGSVIGLGVFGLFALGASLVGTPEGNSAISELEAIEAQMCACDVGDLECVIRGQSALESLAVRHMNTEGTEHQLRQFEQSANRTMACAERALGGF